VTLSSLIRKRDTGSIATAIPAISVTQPKGEAVTVARIATVAVANPPEAKAATPDPATETRRQRVLTMLADNPALRVAVVCDGAAPRSLRFQDLFGILTVLVAMFRSVE